MPPLATEELGRQQHNCQLQEFLFNLNVQRQLMRKLTVIALVVVLALLPAVDSANQFDLTLVGRNGSLYASTCVTQTTLEFQFSSSTTLSTTGTLGNGSSSSFKFLDVYGNDLSLPLTNVALDSSSSAKNFVKGYGYRFSITSSTYSVTPDAAYVFKFSDGANNVYVYIPVTTSGNINNADLIDLTKTGDALGSLSLTATGAALSPFNMFDLLTYNLWYTSVVGTNTILVSNFIYKIGSITGAVSAASSLMSTLTSTAWNANIPALGNKLCYASTITTGNFQTHIRESVPLWFAWFWIFFFWLFYLLSDSTNVKVYDPHYEENKWTCMTLYSLYNLAHEDFYTRLSRSTNIFINWSLQGVIIASIYGSQFMGAPMIIWTALIAFVVTIPIPFILGAIIHKKIYEKFMIKYENMKSMKGIFDKSKLQPLEQSIDTCDEKIYGYYHWFYSLAFVLFFTCWPIAINQMQKLSRTQYYYHWYWLASMGIVFVLEYLIFEPLLALLFGDRVIVRQRGGNFYNFKLGQAYRAAQTN